MLDILLALFMALVIICIWIMLFDSNRFVVRTVSVSDERIKKPYRVVVISDLHNKRYGRDNAYLLSAIDAKEPDAIFIAGDILTAHPKEKLDVAISFVEELAKKYPIYYGNGNHEHRLKLYPEKYGDMAQEYAKALEAAGVKPLVNDHAEIEGTGIVVYGLEIDRHFYKRFTVPEMENEYLVQVLGNADKDKFTCLLAHNPDYFESYAAWGADAVFSGHVHGGMVRIPFWRGVVSPNVRLFPKYDGGIFHHDKSTMVLSRGLGMHTIPIRLFNPGELIVVEFNNSLATGEKLL